MTLSPRVCLCGFMGAGKSVVGQALAAQLGYPFFDLDREVELDHDLSIPDIFSQKGEAVFRKTEEQVGCRLLDQSTLVLALGGGALCAPALLRQVLDASCLVYLEASPETLYARINHKAHRPLLEGVGTYAEFLKVYTDRMTARKGDYERANLTVSTDTMDIQGLVALIVSSMRRG